MSQFETCPMSDLPSNQCSHCLGLDPPRRREGAHGERFIGFPARFDGWCDFCNHSISVGQQIRSHPESFNYVHVECAEEKI